MASSNDRLVANGAAGKMPAAMMVSLALLLIAATAAAFFLYYVPHYILKYDADSYTVYWPRRLGLLPHIAGGTLALFVGPFQLWTGLGHRWPRAHRWAGRGFVIGASILVASGAYLAVTTTYGWAYGVGLMGLAVATATTTGVAWYAIHSGDVATHRRWMPRAYTVVFAFVLSRLLDDWLPTSHLLPETMRYVNDIWVSWALPLLVVIVLQAVSDIRARRTAV